MNYLLSCSSSNEVVTFMNKLAIHDKFMLLSIFIDSEDDELKQLYKTSSVIHNNEIMNDPRCYEAGFDLFLPKNNDSGEDDETKFVGKNKVDFKIKCCAKMIHKNKNNDKNNELYAVYSPFNTCSKALMSKSPLRLENNQGIIDAGYRGNLICMLDCIYYDMENGFSMAKYSRMIQICAPDWVPMYVRIVDKVEELGPSSSSGCGSTGI